jgi:peptide-methionine (S)-S-oxide reductase
LNKSGVWKRPLATRIEAFGFFPAEEYHQDFMRKNPDNSYIRTWDMPKIAALKRLFPKLYR